MPITEPHAEHPVLRRQLEAGLARSPLGSRYLSIGACRLRGTAGVPSFEFVAKHQHVVWRLDTDTNLIATNLYDRHDDRVA